jgi:hypothetical protein
MKIFAFILLFAIIPNFCGPQYHIWIHERIGSLLVWMMMPEAFLTSEDCWKQYNRLIRMDRYLIGYCGKTEGPAN